MKFGRNGLVTALSTMVEVVFPAFCVNCKAEGAFFCDACLAETPRLGGVLCSICANDARGDTCWRCIENPPHFNRILAPFRMDYPVKSAIHSLKYGDLRSLGSRLAQFLTEELRRSTINPDLLTAVPLHSARLRKRGYNQAELLAKHVARQTGLKYRPLLKRVRKSVPQVELSGEQRKRAVKDAFRATVKLDGMKCVLVDDVATTTSTLNAAAQALKKKGATQVFGLVVAREAEVS